MKTGERMSLTEAKQKGLITGGGGVPKTARRGKYNAKPVVIDGYRFDSQLEGAYYLYLQHLQSIGQVGYFMRQVPFYLPGGIRYVVDFQIFGARSTLPGVDTPQGWHQYVDVKGHETKEFKLKRNWVHSVYPQVFIHCVTKDDIDRSYIATVKEIAAASGGKH